MKPFFLFALFASLLVSCGGCVPLSPDDREFFGRHWVNPKELDAERPTNVPNRRDNNPNTLPVTDSNAPSERGREWDTPERY